MESLKRKKKSLEKTAPSTIPVRDADMIVQNVTHLFAMRAIQEVVYAPRAAKILSKNLFLMKKQGKLLLKIFLRVSKQ
mgnify:CR=1 FL=1